MDYQLDGQLACVFAGAHGIGAATANLLAEEGECVKAAEALDAIVRRDVAPRASLLASQARVRARKTFCG